MVIYDFAKEFSTIPGPRFIKLGDNSGELFRETILRKWFQNNTPHIIDVNGVELSFAPSFLSEAFGKLAREYGKERFYEIVKFLDNSEENKYFKSKVDEYVESALNKK